MNKVWLNDKQNAHLAEGIQRQKPKETSVLVRYMIPGCRERGEVLYSYGTATGCSHAGLVTGYPVMTKQVPTAGVHGILCVM